MQIKLGTEIITQKPHHHGNLREALIDSGIELLNEEGAAGLSLRKCAARAGVSHGAPAHHFDGLKGLRTAIAARGWRQFNIAMAARLDNVPDQSKSRVTIACQGYLQFSRDHPALFNTMIGHPESYSQDAEFEAETEAAEAVFVAFCRLVDLGDATPELVEVALWSLLHGYAKLEQINRVQPDSATGDPVSLADVLTLFGITDRST